MEVGYAGLRRPRQATVGSGTTHTITGLTAGTEYTVRVIATRTNAADGPASTEETGTPQRPPTATLVLNPASISESGGISTVTARLSRPTTEATTLTVATTAVSPAVAGDFTRTGNTLTIAAGSTTSAGLVTVTGVDNSAAEGDKRVSVSATASGGHGVSDPAVATLTIRDDEFGLDLGVSVATGLTVTEAGGTAAFTLALLTRPSAAVTVAVSSRDTGEGTVSPSSLVFTTGNWNAARTVTVTGVDDDVDDGTVTWQVRLNPMSGGDGNYDGIDEDVDVTTTDDDDAPGVTLALTPASIAESGAGNVATVTARLSHPSSADTTVTVTASPVSPAVEGNYTLSMATILTIAASATESTGVVTIAAVDNKVDADDKTVRVSGTAANSRAAADSTTMTVTDATLTITDDDEKGLTFDPAAVVEVGEGARQASYTVRLNSEPTGPVTVALTTDGAVEASPETLTFTMADWDDVQTVTVTTSVGAGGYAAALSVAHAASGGDYGGGDGVTGTMSVSVAGATRIRIAGAGTTTYGIAGRRVTVTVESGTPAGIEVDLEGVGAGPPLVLMFSPEVAAATVAEAAGDGFGGLAETLAAARTVVDISVTTGSVPSSGVEICLPVSAGLRAAAAGVRDGSADRALLLLRHDGSAWAEAVEEGASSYDAERMHVCASGVTSFSPFAVGYKDAAPSFEEDFPEAFVWDVDEEIEPVTLPAATGDGTIGYALSPALPEGVERDGFRLSGMPMAEMGVTDYVWTATDADGQVARLEFTIEVAPALDKARARLAALNRSVLPELSRATWGSVVEAVTGRLESSGAGSGMADTLASALKAREGAQDESGVTWREIVEGRTFAVALGGGSGGPGGGSGSGADGGVGGGDGSGAAGAVMWGSGSRRSLALDKGSLDWSGDLFAAHVGMDALLGEGLRGGLAASWIEGEIEYTDRSGDEAVTGVHVSRLAAVHPYLGWSGADGSRLWGALGYGEGEIEIADTEFVERFGVQKGDSAFVGVAAGGSVPVASANGLALALKGSGEATRYSVKDNGSALAAVSVKTQRLRLAAEGSRTWALTGGGTLTPALEVGARWDGGDGETGAGMELGGGLEWTLPSHGLAVEARGRTLAAHEGDVEE